MSLLAQAVYPPMVDQSDEQALARRALAGDVAARNRLVLANLRLVGRVVRRFASPARPSFDDLMSAGAEGLLRAARDWDPGRSERSFAWYATMWIRSHVIAECEVQKTVVSGSRHLRRLRTLHHDLSLDDNIDDDGEDTWIDRITADEAHSPEALVAEVELRALAAAALARRPRDRAVLEERYGDDTPPIHELAARQGVSRQLISMRRTAALERTRARLAVDAQRCASRRFAAAERAERRGKRGAEAA